MEHIFSSETACFLSTFNAMARPEIRKPVVMVDQNGSQATRLADLKGALVLLLAFH